MELNLPHLIVKNFEQKNFTSKGAIVPKKPLPIRNRNEHSPFLKQQLELAWADAKNEEIKYHTNRNGIYLEFKGEQGYELATKSLERIKKGIQLLNIRIDKDETHNNIETTFATIYVPNQQKSIFFNLIEKYANENTISGKPKNKLLIESISNIKKALLVESFWMDVKTLVPTDKPEWCEVWLNSDQKDEIKSFEALLNKLKITFKEGVIIFPERSVKIVFANRKQLEIITLNSNNIAEYKRAKETADFLLSQDNKDQVDWTKNILDRLQIDHNPKVAICILDTGINYGHPLIKPILEPSSCQSVKPEWGNHDHNKHGTLMAGVSAYNNLQEILTHNESIYLNYCLESVKILPSTEQNTPELWGYITAQGVYKAEIQAPNKKRIICLAITSDASSGTPSSWSAELDQICSGAEDGTKRLFLVCAGNASNQSSKNYPIDQLTDAIQNPAQSWNALTVGAYTQIDRISNSQLANYNPIAPANGLSPFSTTSTIWNDMWPIKPEIVMEGGNLAKDPSGYVTDCNDLSLISTFFEPTNHHFWPFYGTSAATAQASWFAAQVQAEYPDYWPETVRGLMVHSAEWTKELKKQFLTDESKTAYKRLLRICGYGIPNLQIARYSASNSLTLISQSELQPFDKKGSRYCTKDMHLYELPWPKEALQSLPNGTKVEMRITLSYFIEPGPGEIGWKDRYRYSSHGLRFDLNSPTDDKDQFLRKVNVAARNEENGHPGTSSVSSYWTLGEKARNKGSIHHDIWNGTAAELATSNLVAIYPTIGWWRERSNLGKWNRKARYSLIISISTPEQTVDLYTPVAIQLGIKVPVEIKVGSNKKQ